MNDLREQVARIEQMQADIDQKRQSMRFALAACRGAYAGDGKPFGFGRGIHETRSRRPGSCGAVAFFVTGF